MRKSYLMIPGPTPVPPWVTQAMSRAMAGHRTAEFSALLARLEERLKLLFNTKNEVFFLAASGTGGLEAAVANSVSAGDKVLALITGNFGVRFAGIARAYGAQVTELHFGWGNAVDLARVAEALQRESFAAVLATHNETSTGALNDIAGVGRMVAKTDALLLVDAISGIGGVEFRADDWGVDIAVTASQKALMLPPGLAVISVSPKVWSKMERVKSPRFYFNLFAYKKSLLQWSTPYTPAVSLLFGLEAALNMIFEEGLENVYRRHMLLGRATRSAVRAMGLQTLVEESCASPTVTAVRSPEGISADSLRADLKEKWGVSFAGGQGELKGEIFRVAHMGFACAMDVLTAACALEMSLLRLGFPVQPGSGVKAAEDIFVEGI